MKNQRTLFIVKPDGVQRSLIGELIQRIERTGLKIIAMKMVIPTKDQVIAHYNKNDEWFLKKGAGIVEDRKKNNMSVEKEAIEYGRDIMDQNVSFMTASPVVAMVVQGSNAVSVVKKLVGSTEPTTSDVGTIRGDYTVDSYEHAGVSERAVRNLVHASDEVDEAIREIAVWFDEKEFINYRLLVEQMLYDVNLDGILE